MHVLDLGDDLLLTILAACISHQAFISLVCRSLCNILRDRDFPCEKRSVNLSSIFINQDCFDYAVHNFNIATKLPGVSRKGGVITTNWSHKAVDVAYSAASLELLWKIFPLPHGISERFSIACRTGRQDILDTCSSVENLCALFNFFRSSTNVSVGVVSSRHFCRTLLDSIVSSPTTNALRLLMDFVGEQKRCASSYWCKYFSNFTLSLHTTFTAAAKSQSAYEMLDILTDLVKSNGNKEHAEEVCVVMVAFSSFRSASAWRWIRDKCGNRSLQDLIYQYQLVPQQLPLGMHLTVVKDGVHMMMLDSFKAIDVESYKVIRDGSVEGGFLHHAFRNVRRNCTFITQGLNFVHSYTVSSALLKTLLGPLFGRLNRCDIAEVLLESIYDLLSTPPKWHDVGRSLQSIFYKFVQQFPYESYITIKKVMAKSAPSQKMLRFVYVALNECILRGMSRVLEDAVNCSSLLHLDEFNDVDRSALLDAIIVQNKTGKKCVGMLRTYLPFCKVAIHHVAESINNGQFMEADELLNHCSHVQKIELGKEVILSRRWRCSQDVHAVKLALQHECFQSGSDYHREAIRIVSKMDLNEAAQKKRKLPFRALEMSIQFRG